ncbi:hypothetical protein B0T24DRAFT_664915 [Lasiosphaeria ovina]|uniref:Uncharacterized protein n=1 Tax=Lasiosphaeria ovina TaxID=92902 RepID=A0AAE0KGH0_9PEZI|nr:hypothetical protein B0T24DRAFT_664915 [Lasiosphaeria ovina]
MANTGNPPHAGLQFVVSTGLEKPDADVRKFIRSHVMKGKNLGKKLQPRSQKSKHARKQQAAKSDAASASDAHAEHDELIVYGSLAPPTPPPRRSSPPPAQSQSLYPGPVPIPGPPASVPAKFGSDVSSIRFPDEVEPGAVEAVLQFSTIAKRVLFPLESCIFFENRAETWIAPLAVDPAFLHVMAFTSQWYFDVIMPGKPTDVVSRRTVPHYTRAIEILRQRFAHDDDPAQLSFTTVAAVMGLAGHAFVTGDIKSARNHMEGLYRIVRLRGGVSGFAGATKLVVEILRIDIGMELHTGSRHIFYGSPDPPPPYPDLTELLKLLGPPDPNTPPQQCPISTFPDSIDSGLARAWQALADFSAVINYAAGAGKCIPTETFRDAMAAVMYQLLDLGGGRFEPGSSAEAVRLALLAFAANVFLQWKIMGAGYAHLTAAFRSCFAQLAPSRVDPRLLVWLLMVGAVSVLDTPEDAWLRMLLYANVRLCDVESWEDMRRLLGSFMWIGMTQDKPGKAMFQSLFASQGVASF